MFVIVKETAEVCSAAISPSCACWVVSDVHQMCFDYLLLKYHKLKFVFVSATSRIIITFGWQYSD
jgi:hypothetical protein